MAIEINKDIYFSNCIGVFQGGGCKALAYIGAYEEACRHGIMFSEVAGTSAGSIIAALIAMGASPGDLKRIVYNLNFMTIIPSPEKPKRKSLRKLLGLSKKCFLANWAIDGYFKANELILGKFCTNLHEKIFKDCIHQNIIESFGIYDSKVLTKLLKGWFKDIFGKSDPSFKDLIVDLHVISTDLRDNSIKIWNKENTPNESIAKAVTASCSIPIFFTPVDDRYVDGCVLSNRPDFIVDDAPNYFRTLSFILKGQTADMETFQGYMGSLIDTVIQGADKIQHKGTNVNEVVIDCEEVGATDFDKMDKDRIDYLLESGRLAMRYFLSGGDDESNGNTPSIHLSNIEQVYSQVAFWSLKRYDEITVVSDSLDWVWVLFPSIKSWCAHNTKLLVYYNSLKQEDRRKRRLAYLVDRTDGLSEEDCVKKAEIRLQREVNAQNAQIRFLESIGAKVHSPEDDVNPEGFYFKKGNDYKAIIYKTIDGKFEGKIYNEKLDSHAIRSQLRTLEEKNDSALSPIVFKKIEENEIIEKLSKISHYENARFSWKDVRLSNLRFLNKFIRGSKYKQILHLFNLYPEDYGWFAPGTLFLKRDKESTIGPIVAERHNGELFVMEGNTRCLFAYRHGIESLKILVVEDVQSPLPVNLHDRPHGFSIDEVRISEKGLMGKKRYKDFEYSLFRPIEQTLRPDKEYLL